jgi:hypothetical protein
LTTSAVSVQRPIARISPADLLFSTAPQRKKTMRTAGSSSMECAT